ncbi:hypothetical protein ACXNSR_35755 [Streptomyces sp. NC-S4]
MSNEPRTLAADRLRVQTRQAAQRVKDATPDPVLHQAGQAATAVRANRTPLLVVGAALVVLLLARHGRGRR